jgi:protein archease
MRPPFEIIEHPADVGFLAYGGTLEELFSNAALAMFSLACEPSAIEERERREIEVTGEGYETLLFAWLAELLAISDAEQIFFRSAQVREVTVACVRGVATGEIYDKTRHRAGTYIKAVTYHQLRVERLSEGWRAQVFLDV